MTDVDSRLPIGMFPPESLRAVYIEMVYSPDGRGASKDSDLFVLAKGTGFFYRVDGQIYLVTARHNFSGKHWETGEYLRSTYRVAPTHVAVGFRATEPTQVYTTGFQVAVRQYLINIIDEAWQPIWREHPRFGRSIDIAAIPFHVPTDQGEVPVDAWDEAAPASDPASKLWASQQIAVVGYPYGLRGSFDLPLWSNGVIASEPALLHIYRDKEYPLFLIDARGRTGNSRSPVLAVRQPLSLTQENGKWEVAVGPRFQLVGVYTGRVPDDYGAREGSAFNFASPPEGPADPIIDYEAANPVWTMKSIVESEILHGC
jgi:Trypsin-like peptidase domain